MSVVLGSCLGVGLWLACSPLLWPQARSAGRRTRGPGRLRTSLALAGFSAVTPVGFVTVSVLLGVAIAAVAEGTLGVSALSITAGLAGGLLPTVVLNRRVKARRSGGRTVWPDAVDQLVAAVRSGLAVPDSVSALAQVGPESVRPAFAQFERDYRATGNFSRCLDELKTRLADPVADRILETLRMAREVGGTELSAVLRNLGGYLREEAAIRAEIEARQSWVVNAARLGAGAPWLVLLLLGSRPEAQSAYNSPAGAMVIVIGFAVSVIAYRLMLWLGRIPQERRWFR